MKTKIIVLSTCILLVLSIIIIKFTVPKVDAKTVAVNKLILPVDSKIIISKLTFKYDNSKDHKTQVIGSITNNNSLDTPVKFLVIFSNLNGISMSYAPWIGNKCVKAGQTINFNVTLTGTDVRNKLYNIKLVSQDSQI